MSFVRESLVQTLKLKRQHAPIPLMGIGTQRNHTTKGAVNLTLRSRHDQNSGCSVLAFILPQLTGQIPSRTIAPSSWPHIDGLELADPDYARPGNIGIILGSDMYGSLLLGGLQQGPQGAPVAQETILGWIISGPTSLPTTTRLHKALHVSSEQGGLHSLVERFWKLEQVPQSSSSQLTREEKLCEEHFIRTHSRASAGRYVVRLPFQDRPMSFGDSHTAAFRALQRIHRRGRKDHTFKQLYATFFSEYLSLGHMSRVPIVANIRFQQLWTEELGWDDPLPANIATNWTTYQDELQSIDVSLPRWLGIQSCTAKMEIHGFSDASLDALGACVYLRVLGEDYDQSHITLISAKTKVAPLKRVTVPRLEMSAALSLARLVNSVCSSLEMESVPVHLWTDSTVTLIWIQSNLSWWKDFVANRVNTIQELMPRAQWRHTPGENNPTDFASRGISTGTLQSCTLW